MSWFSKKVKKLFRPKNLVRLAGILAAPVTGGASIAAAEGGIKIYEKNKKQKEEINRLKNELNNTSTSAAVSPTYTTTSSVTAGGPAANRVTSYQTPLASPQQAAPIQIGTSSEPQAMKLQQTASPYAAANVAAQSQAQAAQQQQQEQKPLNQFMAPSMQGITFGGS